MVHSSATITGCWYLGPRHPVISLFYLSAFLAHEPSQPRIRREILHKRTTVDVDLLTRNVIAIRHKEEHRFGDFLGVSEATHWDLALDD